MAIINSKTVSEIWKDRTGTEWSEAKKRGLSDGTYESNMNLRSGLLKGLYGAPEAVIRPSQPIGPPKPLYSELPNEPVAKAIPPIEKFNVADYAAPINKNVPSVSVPIKQVVNKINDPVIAAQNLGIDPSTLIVPKTRMSGALKNTSDIDLNTIYQDIKPQEPLLPGDVVNTVKEKQENPKFKNFGGKYYVLSKENSHLYAFNNNHKLIDSTAIGRGKTVGDSANLADPNSDNAGPHATTPAGSAAIGSINRSDYTLKHYGSPTYGLDYKGIWGNSQNLALHAIYPAEKDFRESVIKNPEVLDKLVSWGCINVPDKWLGDKKTEPAIGDSVFITKEPMRNVIKPRKPE